MRLSAILSVLLLLAAAPSPARAEDPPVFLLKWGSQGSGPGQFQNPAGIGVGPGGDIYVVDAGLSRVQRFTSTGDFVCTVGSYGSGDGQFHSCEDIAFGPDNLGYVSDYFNGRFQVFDTDCNYIRQWTVPNDYGSSHVAINPAHRVQKFTSTGQFLTSWGSAGPGDGQFSDLITDMCVDPSGNVYVLDAGHYWVQKFGQIATPTIRRTWGGLKRVYRTK